MSSESMVDVANRIHKNINNTREENQKVLNACEQIQTDCKTLKDVCSMFVFDDED